MTLEKYIPESRVPFRLPQRYKWLCYAAVFVLGIGFQLAYFHAGKPIERDSVFYIRGVEVWYRTGDFTKLGGELISSENTTAMKYYTAPFYLFVLKTLKNVFPRVKIETLARYWGLLAAGVTLCLSMLCAKLIFDDDVQALVSGMLLAIYPGFAKLGCMVLRDMTYLLLLILVLYLCLVSWKRRSWVPAAFAGSLCFAGICCRAEFLMLLVALIPLSVWDRLVIRRRSLLIAGAFAASAALGFVIWTLLMGLPWDFVIVYLRCFVA